MIILQKFKLTNFDGILLTGQDRNDKNIKLTYN